MDYTTYIFRGRSCFFFMSPKDKVLVLVLALMSLIFKWVRNCAIKATPLPKIVGAKPFIKG